MRLHTLTMASMLALTSAMASADEVRVYNWSDYIDESLLEKFEQETGIDLIYDVFVVWSKGAASYGPALHFGATCVHYGRVANL